MTHNQHCCLGLIQRCEHCGGNVSLRGAFTSYWNGYRNVFCHVPCFEAHAEQVRSKPQPHVDEE